MLAASIHDWFWHAKTFSDMFDLVIPIVEKILRPILVYVFLVIALRIFGKRELTNINPFDFVVLHTLSNTVQNAIIGEDNSLVGGLLGALVLVVVNSALDREGISKAACLGFCPPAGVIVPRVMDFALQPKPTPYDAVYSFAWLSASGTACLVSALLSALFAKMSFGTFLGVVKKTIRQLVLAESTIAIVLGLAFLMNYSGATGTLGLMFAATGKLFPFFGALLGWMGVFLTGSDTSANALFGSLQEVTAVKLHMSPVLMAAVNSSGGVMGKMISLQNIAVAAAATSMATEDESKLFRFTLRHSIFLASVIGLIAMVYAYTWAAQPQ